MPTYLAPYSKTSWRAMVLSEAQMQTNATYIYNYMRTKYGWSLAAVAGLLANAETESTINPARPQNNAVNNQWWDSAPGRTGTAPTPTTTWYGFGLFQVTPWYAGPGTRRYNPYTLGNWALNKGYTASYATCGTIGGMDVQLDWLVEAAAEHFNNPADNNRDQVKWYQHSNSPLTAPTPTAYGQLSGATPENCALTFYWNLERSDAQNPGSRPSKARKWFEYLGGEDPGPTPPDPGPDPGPDPEPEPPTPTPVPTPTNPSNWIIIAKSSGLF